MITYFRQLRPVSSLSSYIFLSIILHVLVLLLLTIDIIPSIKYELLEINLNTSEIPFVIETPRPKIQKPVVKEIIKQVNKTVEVTTEDKAKEIIDEPQEDIVPSADVEVDPNADANSEVEVQDYEPFYSVDLRPSFLKEAILVYPLKQKLRGIEGIVIIEVDIDTLGTLRNYRLIKSAGEAFDEAAINKILNSTYRPGFKEGKNIAVRMRFTIRFQLTSQSSPPRGASQ